MSNVFKFPLVKQRNVGLHDLRAVAFDVDAAIIEVEELLQNRTQSAVKRVIHSLETVNMQVRRVVDYIPDEPIRKMMLVKFAAIEQQIGILRGKAALLCSLN